MSSNSSSGNNNSNDNDDDEKVKALALLHARARQKIREHGGLLTTNQAIEMIRKEDREKYVKAIDELAEFEPFWAQYRDKPMPDDEMQKHLRRYDEAIAFEIKQARMQYVGRGDLGLSYYRSAKDLISDEMFERMFKEEHYPNNPQEFDELVADLKKKGLLY
jgi:hypothetical protein